MLANYLKDRFLTIEIFDADSRFHFATAKIPLFELLRQQKSHVVRAKECEICAPDTAEFRGSIQLIMTNVGKSSVETTLSTVNDLQQVKTGGQPGQGLPHGYKKIVHSRPMDLTKVS